MLREKEVFHAFDENLRRLVSILKGNVYVI